MATAQGTKNTNRTFTADDNQRASASRKINNSAREATWVGLDNGWRLGRDATPGVGWRLEGPSQPRRYYRSRDAALAAWVANQAKWELLHRPRPK